MTRRQFQRRKAAEQGKAIKAAVRKHLSADALINIVRDSFEQLPEPSNGTPKIPIADALMSGVAMFALKSPSLLAFENAWEADDTNLKSIFKINSIPSDTQMRTRLDLMPPDELRAAPKAILNNPQRGRP